MGVRGARRAKTDSAHIIIRINREGTNLQIRTGEQRPALATEVIMRDLQIILPRIQLPRQTSRNIYQVPGWRACAS